ncbi:MAG: phospholipid-binding protein MlaC [Alphaproteobacteria bacterium]
MQRHLRLVLVVFGLTSFTLTPSQAAKHEDRHAEQFVQTIAGQGFEIIDNPNWSADQKRQRFRKLMGQHIAFRLFGRSALGPYARIPSKQQFGAYVDLLKEYAAYAMQSQLNEYKGQAIRVLSSRVKDSGRLSYVSVNSEVYDRASGKVEGTAKWLLIRRLDQRSSGDAASLGGMRKTEASTGGDAQYKVYDLVLQTAGESASFSLLQTQRDEFTAILSRHQRQFDALLAHIKEQIRKIQEPD